MNPIAPDAVTVEISVNQEEEATKAIIFRLLGQLAELKGKQKIHKEMLENTLMEDDRYEVAVEACESNKKTKKQEKTRILQNNQMAMAKAEDVAVIREDLKDVKTSLENHLLNYTLATGKDFLDHDGTRITIVRSAKIKPNQLSLFEGHL